MLLTSLPYEYQPIVDYSISAAWWLCHGRRLTIKQLPTNRNILHRWPMFSAKIERTSLN